MKKQLETELKQLAINILNNDSNTDLATLKKQTIKIYENLSVLTYLENKPEIVTKESSSTISLTEEIENNTPIETLEPIIDTISETITKEIESEPNLLFELDELTSGFENLPEFEPATTDSINTISTQKTSLNDSLNKGINIGLNDRLAFVKQLFDNDMDNYTRVISQLNTLESSSDAKNFIQQMVKPEYNNWEGKEEIEKRFMNTVFRKFDA